MTLADTPPLLTAKAAAELLGVSQDLVLRAIHAGQLPTVKLGRSLYISTPRLIALLESGDWRPQLVERTRAPRQSQRGVSIPERIRAAR